MSMLSVLAKTEGYVLSPGAQIKAENQLKIIASAAGNTFGNGRSVRTFLEAIKNNYAERAITQSKNSSDRSTFIPPYYVQELDIPEYESVYPL